MYETYPKGSQHPSMSKGNQSKKDYLGHDDQGKRSYPGKGTPGSAGKANEQHYVLKAGSGLMGAVPCGSAKKFPTEKGKEFVKASKKAAVTKRY